MDLCGHSPWGRASDSLALSVALHISGIYARTLKRGDLKLQPREVNGTEPRKPESGMEPRARLVSVHASCLTTLVP
jgi:hypothetical protein